MPFDPGLNRGLSQIGDAQMLPASFPANVPAKTATKNADADRLNADRIAADRIEADRIGGVDRIIGHASERVTMDDLLGMPANPGKKKMDIYMGANKNTLEFEEESDETLDTLRRGGRISTPIVERPAQRPQPLGTALATPRTNPGSNN